MRIELWHIATISNICLYLEYDHDCRLRDELYANLSGWPFYKEEPVEIRSGMLAAEDLVSREGPFPESLRGRHAANTWLVCRKQLVLKRR